MSQAQPTMDLDWLIIGGGIHGVHIATRLITDADISADAVRIIDPGHRLLERWHDCTATTGMTHLRSPSVHHLDVDPLALQRFAGRRKARSGGLFAAPFERPSLALFNDHCEKITERLGLEDLHIRSKAIACTPDGDGIRVRLSDGRIIDARNIVLAVGAGDQPEWPEWAPRRHPRIHHVFENGFSAWPSTPESVLVIGGGISAGQVALRLMTEGHQVSLVSRHALRTHQFDSDPGWLGPRYTAEFQQEPDLERRRAAIARARHRGSVPPDVGRSIKRAIIRKRIDWHQGHVTGIEDHPDGISIKIDPDSDLIVDRILLATGFSRHRPGGTMVDDLIASASLPCARCGYPIVDPSLRWHPGVYVSGPLAELELGPVSRNIAGARRAADRIAAAAREGSATSTTSSAPRQ
ncbi:MAG: SidA/IucD/PvdA family monooxygenase [Phycisphaera sp.]|nr:SidA/IucD/PvdA family monooxygenase [Phycisphaera sp.]